MAITEMLKRNEIHGGTCTWGNCSITKDVHIGDLVELLVDGKFFQRHNSQYERYGGYVTSIDNFSIGVSSTHTNNKYHGYVSGQDTSEQQKVVKIETTLIREYRVLSKP